jgi:hypothetical protein
VLNNLLSSLWPSSRTSSRVVAALVIVGCLLAGTSRLSAQQLSQYQMELGRHTEANPLKGYVSALGRVRACALNQEETTCGPADERHFVWAEYLPGTDLVFVNRRPPEPDDDGNVDLSRVVYNLDQSIPPVKYEPLAHEEGVKNGTLYRVFLQGPVRELELAKEEQYKTATVLSADLARSLLRQKAALEAAESSHAFATWDLMTYQTDPDAPGVAPSTTHVLVRTAPKPGQEKVALEFPFNPNLFSGGEEDPDYGLMKSLLVATEPPEQRGTILEMSAGQIAYLTDYFSPFTKEELVANGLDHTIWECEKRDTEGNIKFEGFPASQNFRARFDRCGSSHIKEVLGPLMGAEISLTTPGGYNDRGCTKLTPDGYQAATEADADFCGTIMYDANTYTHEDGSYFMHYAFPNDMFEVVDVYVNAELAPGTYHRPGSMYTRRQKHVVGSSYGLLLDPIHSTWIPPNKELNFAVDAAFLAGRAVFANYDYRADDGIPLGGSIDVFVVHPGTSDEAVGTTYDDAPPPLPPNRLVDVGGVQRHASLTPDLVHRGLLRTIRQADLLNTDLYVYECDGSGNVVLGSASYPRVERRGLKWNELFGLVPNPDGTFTLSPPPEGEDPDRGTPLFQARFEPQMMLPHPGNLCLKLYLVNRVTW